GWVQRTRDQTVGSSVAQAASSLLNKLGPIEQELIERRLKAQGDMLHYPTRLNARLAALSSVVASSDSAPTRQSYEVLDDLSARIDQQLQSWRDLLEVDLAEFNALVQRSGVPAVVPLSSG